MKIISPLNEKSEFIVWVVLTVCLVLAIVTSAAILLSWM